MIAAVRGTSFAGRVAGARRAARKAAAAPGRRERERERDAAEGEERVDSSAEGGLAPPPAEAAGLVYVIESPASPPVRPGARTYVGATKDVTRRLRQHNGELAGGARSTRGRGASWRLAGVVEGFASWEHALSFEWRVRHPDGKRRRLGYGSGLQGRKRAVERALAHWHETRAEDAEGLRVRWRSSGDNDTEALT